MCDLEPPPSASAAVVPQPYTERGTVENDAGQRKVCRFSRSLLGSCSGLTDKSYGFKEGKPCLIVKLNRIVNFRPKVGLLMRSKIITGLMTRSAAVALIGGHYKLTMNHGWAHGAGPV